MDIFKPRKLRLKRRRITKSRRVFGFSTHESQIRLVKFRGKPRVFRPAEQHGKKIFAERDLLRLQIFHALFPENSLAPASIGFVEEGDKHVWGVLTKVLTKRSSDYKNYQKIFYSNGYPFWATRKETEAEMRHMAFSEKVARPLLLSIKEAAGIDLDAAAVNVCNVEGKPVFFEIFSIDPQKCANCIERSITNKAKKKRLFDALNRLQVIERKLQP